MPHRRFFNFLILLTCAVALGACSDKKNIRENFEVPANARAFLEKVRIFHPDGSQGPPADEYGEYPFALLYDLGEGGVCSSTHVRRGLVATAAHCVGGSTRPGDFWVVYYNKRGERTYSRITEIVYDGSNRELSVGDHFDMAILKIDSDTANDWHSQEGRARTYRSGEIGASTPVQSDVSLYVFNPLSHHPRIKEDNQGTPGGVFDIKRCKSSRTRPASSSTLSLAAPGIFAAELAWNADARYAQYMDKCTWPIVQGNSGGMIARSSDSREWVSVVSHFRYLRGDGPFRGSIRGNDGRTVTYNSLFADQERRWDKPGRNWIIEKSSGTINYFHTLYIVGNVFSRLSEVEPTALQNAFYAFGF